MEDILREEMKAAVGNLMKRKSPGEDNITAEMIQAEEESSVEMMYTLCVKGYTRKRAVKQTGEKLFIRKKDKRDCNNYRGISLLSVPCRKGIHQHTPTATEEICRRDRCRRTGGVQGRKRHNGPTVCHQTTGGEILLEKHNV